MDQWPQSENTLFTVCWQRGIVTNNLISYLLTFPSVNQMFRDNWADQLRCSVVLNSMFLVSGVIWRHTVQTLILYGDVKLKLNMTKIWDLRELKYVRQNWRILVFSKIMKELKHPVLYQSLVLTFFLKFLSWDLHQVKLIKTNSTGTIYM